MSTVIGIAALAFGGFNLAALTLVERRRDLGIARSLGFPRQAVAGVALVRRLACRRRVRRRCRRCDGRAPDRSRFHRARLCVRTVTPAASWALGVGIVVPTACGGTLLALRAPSAVSVHLLLDER